MRQDAEWAELRGLRGRSERLTFGSIFNKASNKNDSQVSISGLPSIKLTHDSLILTCHSNQNNLWFTKWSSDDEPSWCLVVQHISSLRLAVFVIIMTMDD